MKSRLIFLFSLIFFHLLSFSQEKILSDIDNYFDFLVLDGATERPYLSFRTLSDSKWTNQSSASSIWKENFETKSNKKYKSIIIYNPDLLLTYNGTSP